jgi:hypothetical protein
VSAFDKINILISEDSSRLAAGSFNFSLRLAARYFIVESVNNITATDRRVHETSKHSKIPEKPRINSTARNLK